MNEHAVRFFVLLAARGESWLDEVLSLGLATSARGAWDLVTRLHHDNNPILNSLWMRAMGEDAPTLLHRLPGVLAGTVAVILLGRWRWQASPSLSHRTLLRVEGTEHIILGRDGR